MSPIVQSSGVYSLEQDQSIYQQSQGSLNPGIVLYTGWGDYNVVKTVTSISELILNFGEADSSAYTGLIGIKKYFKYGSLLKVVRAVGSSDAYASHTFNNTADPSLKIQAVWKGVYGNNISVKISTGADSKKQISVYLKGVLVETYKGLEKSSASDKNANYKAAINGISEWITVLANSTADAETSEPDDIEATLLTGGVSSLPSKAAFIGTSTGGPNSGPSGLQCFANDSVSLNILLCPDSVSLSSESDAKDVSKELESIAETRKDLVSLVDIPAGNSRDNAITYADSTAAWNSTYVAAYWPWLQVYDSAIDQNVYIPASCGALVAITKNDIIGFPWFAPAGYGGRGNITEASAVEYNTSRADRDLLQGSQINVLVNESGVGVVILGNFTKTSTAKATQSLSIRRGLLFIKLALATVAKSLLFEQNDDITRARLKSGCDSVLSIPASKRGLRSFLTVCNSTNNPPAVVERNELVLSVVLEVIGAVNVITLNLNVSQSGASFDE